MQVAEFFRGQGGGLKLEINIPSQRIRAKQKGGLINEGGVISNDYGTKVGVDSRGLGFYLRKYHAHPVFLSSLDEYTSFIQGLVFIAMQAKSNLAYNQEINPGRLFFV